MGDETRIRELLARRVEAMRAGDAEALVADYLPEVVAFTLAPPLRHTAPEVLDPATMRSWFATFDSAVDFEMRDLRVEVGGGVAFCHSLNRVSAVPRGGAEAFQLWFRSTVCLREVDGAWRIAHEHTSTPFHMDGSFSSAVDLTP
ncbi:ketosteroid isomerase-like protein [Saccharothrix tamanrassetensis]|uniref:Ketosteroid isomerase-like protein n=1 Tax=Saccharothrix tamanrassetensis TaxID=1051531 RepID=A0A841CB15_9PSEU|nr:nuclear transport factor 2 family protein [Saccharothrix tamanrassetensis]MBB5953534.1 ketosteroid isomerase-like protein [Saccharothrix tamanrassetensis]